jgi:hypothetical protein
MHYGRCNSTTSNNCQLSDTDYLANGCINRTEYKDYDGTCTDQLTKPTDSQVCASNQLIFAESCAEPSKLPVSDYLNAKIIGERGVDTPYVCADGTAAAVSFRPFGGTTAVSCAPRVVCPTTTPYLCYDKSCESEPSNCPAVSEDIAADYDECPAARPILCSSGVCVAKVQECQRPDPRCAPTQTLRCANGICVDSYAKCLPSNAQKDGSLMCPGANGLVFLCPDGSCAINSYSCLSIISGCNDPANPIKTSNGGCSNVIDKTATTITCTNTGHKACEDGVCRETCPDYNGCPISK